MTKIEQPFMPDFSTTYVPMEKGDGFRSSHFSSSLSIAQDSRFMLAKHQPDKIELTPPALYEEEMQKLNMGKLLKGLVDQLTNIQQFSLKEKQGFYEYTVNQVIMENKKATELRLEQMEEKKESTFWDFLQQVATCILSTVSIVIGGALIATGAGSIAGGLLIASGVAGISAFVLGEVGVNPTVVGALALTSAALGIGAGIASFATIANQLPKLVATIASSLVNVGQGVTEMGIAYQHYKMSMLDAKQSDIEGRLSLFRSDLEKEGKAVTSAVKSFEETEKIAALIAQHQNELGKFVTQGFAGAGIAG
ncbi:MAG: hypothetical protein HY860_04330 [Chlamydiales bacterium]|nr:hypothetical protein [Chlamydiales bacterium]